MEAAWSEDSLDALGVGTMRELEELMTACYHSTELFARTIFPDVFYRPFSDLHKELCRILDDDTKQQVAIAAPRGFGKRSLFSLAYPAKRILFRDSQHIIPISATADAAIEQSDDLKDQLVENPVIRALFGPMEPQEQRDPFGMKEWVTATGCKVRPRGAGQQIRGRKWRSQRPDLFPIDDLEDDEGVESDDRRMKLKRWFFSAVYNSVDRASRDWRIVVIGTVLHEDSLLMNLLEDPDWYAVRFELCDDAYRSNWPAFMSDQEVKALADSFRAKGMLDVFYREYRNIPIAREDQGFKPEYFKVYTETEEELNSNPDVETVVLADPARTMSKGSANTAVAAVSVDVHTGKLYIREAVERQMSPPELYDEMFAMALRTNALVMAPEVTGLHEYIMYPLRNEMARRGIHYITIEVKPREGKTGPRRSAGLIPLYRQGLIFHSEQAAGVLERYLLQWPRPPRWDVIDAVSGIIYVLEEGERYFTRPAATPEEVEAEYEDLYNEPPLVYKRVI